MFLKLDSILLPTERIVDEVVECCIYANNEERRIAAGECQKLCHVVIVLERVACDGAQHEEAQCTTDIIQRLLENAELD